MTRADLLRRLHDILRRADVDDAELLERELEKMVMSDELLDSFTEAGVDALRLGRGWVGFIRGVDGVIGFARVDPATVAFIDRNTRVSRSYTVIRVIAADEIPPNHPVWIHGIDGRAHVRPAMEGEPPIGHAMSLSSARVGDFVDVRLG